MTTDIETTFIRFFVRRERRERARFELSSPSRRGIFLSRLCHTYRDVLDTRWLTPVAEPNSDYRDVLRLLIRKQAPDTCSVISTINALDGQHLRLADALKQVVGFGLPSIVICIPDGLCYLESEQEYGAPPRYILERVYT